MKCRSILAGALLALAATVAVRAQVSVIPLTSTGNASRPAISPDGKFVAYVQVDDGQASVWVRQIASNANARILAPTAGVLIDSLTVGPDGSFVDFVRREMGTVRSLWRVPALGGEPRKLVDDVSSSPGWSPDGKQMAFVVTDVLRGRASVMVADAEGLHSRVLATRDKLPQRYQSIATQSDLRPVWMPDGRSIVVIGDDTTGAQLVTLDVATGAETIQSFSGPFGMTLARDGRSFMVSVSGPPLGKLQLWKFNLSDGRPAIPIPNAQTRITNDANDYRGVSLAGDTLVSARQETRSSLWVADAAGNGARQVGRDVPGTLRSGGLAWAAEGRLIYAATTANASGLWSTDLMGAGKLIIPGGNSPSTSADGQVLVFDRGGIRGGIWHADADGTNVAQISATGYGPAVTPDGSAVVYNSSERDVQSPWTVDFRGLNPRQFAPMFATARPDISPDGRLVVLGSRNAKGEPEAAVVPIGGGEPIRRLSIKTASYVHWTPDGRELAYVDPDSPSNIWIQSLEGGIPRQLTHFTDGRRIIAFAWSHDGQQLALARAQDISDIVMFKGIP